MSYAASPLPSQPQSFFQRWYHGPCGYREVFILAFPLIMSTGSYTLQQFFNRMFMAWRSEESLAAIGPAHIFSFTLISFFMGTASYANAFVAQYTGAGRPERIGPAMWQSLWFSGIASVALVGFAFLGKYIFAWAHHDPAILALENEYFTISCMGGGLVVYANASSTFYSGRGKPWIVMWVSMGAVATNVVLDYCWIFGKFGFPEWGMRGAAWATVVANVFRCVAYTVLFLLPENRRRYNTLRGWKPERELFGRLMRYGLPSGAQFFLDMLAFSLFVLLVGRLGAAELAATNLATNINLLAFLPMMGFGIAVSTLVGQYLGANRPDLATRATWSAFHMTMLYMGAIAACYLFLPRLFIAPFASRADADFGEVERIAILLLRFVAFYSIFDTVNIVFTAALKGAGDTRFVMWWSLGLAWLFMVMPTWWATRPGGPGIYWAWAFLTFDIVLCCGLFLYRFQHGKWKHMRVIEQSPKPAV